MKYFTKDKDILRTKYNLVEQKEMNTKKLIFLICDIILLYLISNNCFLRMKIKGRKGNLWK